MELPSQHVNPHPRVNPPPQEAGERLPQWTYDETREFLAMRAQLDKSFAETRRNKPLWEAISSMLRQKGFHRTPDQCKSKWKNLVSRFKGSGQSVEGEINRQFPFDEEMRRIFSERMERVLVAEKEGKVVERKRRRKMEREKTTLDEEVEGALREFMRRQLEMEARWVKAAEARETARRATEEEWRRVMGFLQEERMQMERTWREREEERRSREEARSERRHTLVMALLDKLAQMDL